VSKHPPRTGAPPHPPISADGKPTIAGNGARFSALRMLKILQSSNLGRVIVLWQSTQV
jgi:hypothetical protein